MSHKTMRIDEDLLKDIMELYPKHSFSEVVRELIKNRLNKYSFLDNDCPALGYINGKYACIWGREGKTPQIKELSTSEEEVRQICKNCKETLNLKRDNVDLREQIKKEREEVVIIPFCSGGGKLNDDLSTMWCPKISGSRPIYKRKNKSDYKPCKEEGKNNSNCPYLKHTELIKGKLPKPDENK